MAGWGGDKESVFLTKTPDGHEAETSMEYECAVGQSFPTFISVGHTLEILGVHMGGHSS